LLISSSVDSNLKRHF